MPKKSEIFPLRISFMMKEKIRKESERSDVTMTEYIRAAVREKLNHDESK